MLIPFLNFAGKAAEAIAFYETVFAITDKQVSLYGEMPAEMRQHFPPDTDHYVLHSEMKINGSTVWIGDSTQDTAPGDQLTLAVPFATKGEVQVAFDKLSSGGQVHMPLAQTFYSPLFGTVEDRFGVIWHLIVR